MIRSYLRFSNSRPVPTVLRFARLIGAAAAAAAAVAHCPPPPNCLNPQFPKQRKFTYLFVKVVACELHSAIGHYSDAVCAVARHHSAPTLLAPHFAECLADAHLIIIAADILDLQQDF